jgi:hypothetical protein
LGTRYAPDKVEIVPLHTPALFLHAVHHALWLPMANAFIEFAKVVYGRSICCWPNKGYGVGILLFIAVPL